MEQFNNKMEQLENNLSCFNGTSLESLDLIKLMKRYDTKFVFHRNKLDAVFDFLRKGYSVLEIDKKRVFKYENLYYDTDDYFFYHQHHNRRVNRYKVRCRKYIESNECYFEIKFKNNKMKTIKTRILLDNKEILNELTQESKEFAKKSVLINNGTGNIIDRIKPSILISFNRITFADHINKERLTFDINLTFTDKDFHSQTINNLIIAELKSENASLNSPFFQYLKGLKIFPGRFSKYCMGIASTEKNVKTNRFKKRLLNLNNFR